MKVRKVKWNRIFLTGGVFLVLLLGILFLVTLFPKERAITLKDLTGMTKSEVEEYGKIEGLQITFIESYDKTVEKDKVISYTPSMDSKLQKGDTVTVTISLGEVPKEVYAKNNVNELGKVPIMMYHGIIDMASNETKYTGGNVDKDGYNRTAEAFREDLEFYYQSGYRMVRLIDYVHGNIDVPLGKSPIVLTFDDGREDNFKVLGRNEDGSLQIDPNCAVGILEELKEKYPDFQVTATFFVNSGLFQQKEYNEEILKWLVDHGYDVGNHTTTHPDFTKISESEATTAVGKVYQQLDAIIPGKYVPIVALPYGSPYKKSHVNFSHIMHGEIDGYTYQTEAALRVGWDSEVSPFSRNFDPTFLKRVRAYDNDGEEFDIAMVFTSLEKTRYISDGDPDTIVVPEGMEDSVKDTTLEVITY